MKKTLLAFLFCLSVVCLSYSQSIAYRNLYDDTRVSSIYITLPADSLTWLYNNISSNNNIRSTFVFDDGQRRDTLRDVGFRLRGNSSRGAEKKSFKVKFNAYTGGRKYQGVKELNLNGAHNDPTIVREKLYYDVWNRFGLPPRRVNHAKVYLNGRYYGLYINAEEMDDEWLEKAFGVDTGNLYKCTYPADLKYLGENQSSYKAIMNNPQERAYDLKTNELADNYSDLVRLCRVYSQTAQADIPRLLPQVLDVNGFLKAYAVEIMLGHWDDYAYNKNNYFMYNNPRTGVFHYISYDTDNTFGIDWVNKDWGVRDINTWHSATNAPLVDKVLKSPFYKNLLNQHIKSLIDNVLVNLNPRIDSLRLLLTPAATDDTYRTRDYGFTLQNFTQNYETTPIRQAKYGLKGFLQTRIQNARAQLQVNSTPSVSDGNFVKIFPNPTAQFFTVQWHGTVPNKDWRVELWDLTGKMLQTKTGFGAEIRLDTEGVSAGVYLVKVIGETSSSSHKILIR
jgi:hypothetical protein